MPDLRDVAKRVLVTLQGLIVPGDPDCCFRKALNSVVLLAQPRPDELVCSTLTGISHHGPTMTSSLPGSSIIMRACSMSLWTASRRIICYGMSYMRPMPTPIPQSRPMMSGGIDFARTFTSFTVVRGSRSMMKVGSEACSLPARAKSMAGRHGTRSWRRS